MKQSMKKLFTILSTILSFFLVSNVVAQNQSFKDKVEDIIVRHDRYKIAVKYTRSGHQMYIPMRKIFMGKVLREWVYSDRIFTSRYKALEVIREWKEEEKLARKLKRTEYIYLD